METVNCSNLGTRLSCLTPVEATAPDGDGKLFYILDKPNSCVFLCDGIYIATLVFEIRNGQAGWWAETDGGNADLVEGCLQCWPGYCQFNKYQGFQSEFRCAELHATVLELRGTVWNYTEFTDLAIALETLTNTTGPFIYFTVSVCLFVFNKRADI